MLYSYIKRDSLQFLYIIMHIIMEIREIKKLYETQPPPNRYSIDVAKNIFKSCILLNVKLKCIFVYFFYLLFATSPVPHSFVIAYTFYDHINGNQRKKYAFCNIILSRETAFTCIYMCIDVTISDPTVYMFCIDRRSKQPSMSH